MEENSFEKQVQDKMDELKIQPSGDAWENIESRIAKKKSKKWGILFLLFCIILGGSYFYWHSMQHSISKEARVGKSSTNKTAINEKSSQEKKSITSSVKRDGNEKNLFSVNKKSESISNTLAYIKTITKQYIKPINKKRNLKTSIDLSQSPEQYFAKQKKTKKSFAGKASTEIEAAIAEQTQQNDLAVSENDSLNQRSNANSLQQKASEYINKKIKDTSKETKAVVKTVKNIGKNKWKIGAFVLPGISYAGNSFISSNSPSYLNYPLAGNNQGLPGRTVVTSSTIKPGFAFIAGVFAEKNITKKTKFVIGVNYKSFTTSSVLNDSILSFNKNKYVNHFNFIEIPLSIKIQINKGKYVPLIWQGGFSISQLISSNAFQFNSASGLYFTNDSFFNKTQIGFSTSLSAELLSKQKRSILIGPYFYYGASKIANEGLYNKSHFTFIGLRAEYIFGK